MITLLITVYSLSLKIHSKDHLGLRIKLFQVQTTNVKVWMENASEKQDAE